MIEKLTFLEKYYIEYECIELDKFSILAMIVCLNLDLYQIH